MSVFTRNPIALAAAVAGFFATAFTGWQLASDPQVTADVSVSFVTKTSNRSARGASRFGTPAHVRERLASIRAAGSKEERMRATLELVNKLPVSELQAWMDGRWFDTGDRFEMTLFNKIATDRWEREDPAGLVAWSLKNSGVRANNILTSWAKADPSRLTSYFKEHPNDPMEFELLSTMAESHPDMALAGLKEMISRGLPHDVSEYEGNELLRQVAIASPGELEAMMDDLPASWRTKVEVAIIGQKLQASFPDEIRKLWERPDGWKLFAGSLEGDNNSGDKLLGELANMPASWRTSISGNYHELIDESNAAKWLDADLEGSGFTPEQADRLRFGALQHLSFHNPKEVLKRMAEQGLDARWRSSLIAQIFSNASPDSGAQEELLALLESDEDRKLVTGMLTEQRSTSEPQPKIEKPEEWLARVGDADDSHELFRQLEGWDKEKIATLAGQFRTMPDEDKRRVARLIVGAHDELDPSFKGDAIDYFVAHPDDPDDGDGDPFNNWDPVRLASQHAVNWSVEDPVAASAWVQRLPAGDAKLWAQKNLAANWAQYDPEAAGRWAASLPTDAREAVQGFMEDGRRK